MTLAGRAVTLERTGLIERLEAHQGPVLLRAPSGFGKTTLLEQWATRTGRRIVYQGLGESYHHQATLKGAFLDGLLVSNDLEDLDVLSTAIFDDFDGMT